MNLRFGWILVFSLGMGVVILPVWLLLLFPLTLAVPARSFLWKPGILTTLGFFAGPILVGIGSVIETYQRSVHSDLRVYNKAAYIISELVPFGIPAAFIGAATCFVAARLHRRRLAKLQS